MALEACRRQNSRTVCVDWPQLASTTSCSMRAVVSSSRGYSRPGEPIDQLREPGLERGFGPAGVAIGKVALGARGGEVLTGPLRVRARGHDVDGGAASPPLGLAFRVASMPLPTPRSRRILAPTVAPLKGTGHETQPPASTTRTSLICVRTIDSAPARVPDTSNRSGSH